MNPSFKMFLSMIRNMIDPTNMVIDSIDGLSIVDNINFNDLDLTDNHLTRINDNFNKDLEKISNFTNATELRDYFDEKRNFLENNQKIQDIIDDYNSPHVFTIIVETLSFVALGGLVTALVLAQKDKKKMIKTINDLTSNLVNIRNNNQKLMSNSEEYKELLDLKKSQNHQNKILNGQVREVLKYDEVDLNPNSVDALNEASEDEATISGLERNLARIELNGDEQAKMIEKEAKLKKMPTREDLSSSKEKVVEKLQLLPINERIENKIKQLRHPLNFDRESQNEQKVYLKIVKNLNQDLKKDFEKWVRQALKNREDLDNPSPFWLMTWSNEIINDVFEEHTKPYVPITTNISDLNEQKILGIMQRMSTEKFEEFLKWQNNLLKKDQKFRLDLAAIWINLNLEIIEQDLMYQMQKNKREIKIS